MRCAGEAVHEADGPGEVRWVGLESRVEILGVELVGMFLLSRADLTCLRLVESSLRLCQPDYPSDLIT